MRRRFALAAALPALVSLAAMAFLADRLIRRALEDELDARLVVAAQAAAAALPADRITRLAPGDEGTRSYRAIRVRLDALARATSTRLLVLRSDRTVLADSAGTQAIGEPAPTLERDRLEIALAAGGKPVASQVLFEGSDGLLYKTGYAPLRGADGKVVAVVGADGTAPSFATYRRFRRLFALFAVAGAVLGALVAAVASLSVTRPLTRLTAAARRIGRGDLATPLWERRRRDEIGTLRDTLEEMRRALHARDEEREMLLAGIAHEVRNPLGALDLFAGLLAEELAGRPEAAHVDRLRSELAALEKVVGEFLDYARARPRRREAVELAEVAAEVAELCGPLAEVRTGLGHRRRQGDRPGRPRAAPPGAPQPGPQRGGGGPGRRRGADLGPRRRPRRRAGGERPRPRPLPRRPRQPLPPLLHHQGARHRPRPGPGQEGGRRPRRLARAAAAGGRRDGGAVDLAAGVR